MKKNSSKKNLVLSKQTIAHLNGYEMRGIMGGTSKPVPTCCPCPVADPSLDTELT